MNYQKMKEQLQGEVDKFFRPEFLNRLDDVIVFRALTKENILDIVDIEMRGIQSRLAEKGLVLELTPEAREFVVGKGTNLDYGARPLRRAIERYIEDPLAEEMLKSSFEGKNVVLVKLEGDGIIFEGMFREKTPESPAEEVPAKSP